VSKDFRGKRFKGQVSFEHGRAPGIGILVVNLGTPDAATPAAVRRYLAEFLSDSRVVEIPALLWKVILHGIILRTRPAKSARAYARVWSESGSPLMASSSALTELLDKEMKRRIPGNSSVVLAMRYGQPSIQLGLERLQSLGAERILVLPLYPQYSGATVGTVADAVFATLSQWRWVPELRMMGAYHDDPDYIHAIAESIRRHWSEQGHGDKLFISFHGMPRATLEAGDPYFCHCHKTARLLAAELELHEDQWEMAFQSRFGKAEWLQPYAAERLVQLPREGVKHLTVVCPGFAVDCLETLDEIAMEGRDSFLHAGGEHFDYVPALNASAQHVSLLADRLMRHASGWPELAQDYDPAQQQEQLSVSRQYALAAGGS
jgi:protoporphyrin/coproporphyrin ferrochelatase